MTNVRDILTDFLDETDYVLEAPIEQGNDKDWFDRPYVQAEADLNQHYYQMFMEIIGNDGEITGNMRPQGYMNVDLTESYRNKFREELRQQAKLKLMGGEDE